MLDPERDFGDRTVDDIVEGVESGEILIYEGANNPVLRLAATNMAIKGTGVFPNANPSGPQVAALNEFRKMAMDDVPEYYNLLWKAIKGKRVEGEIVPGDPRYFKIYAEIMFGKIGEIRGGGQIAEAFKAVVEAMQHTEERSIDAEWHEVE